ncbi:MAG TPA: hypothetical protein VMU30_12310 [Bacteroidota bacterium]|nr:hypothetical protein [Bacteroidota bacterium]
MARTRFITHYCAYCRKDTKMEVVGGVQQADAPVTDIVKSWYRCTKCKHSALLALDSKALERKAGHVPIDREQCVSYSKEKVYTIGGFIYHSEWDDVGKIVRKDKTSDGYQSIVVAFEKLGERKLLENVQFTNEDIVAPN